MSAIFGLVNLNGAPAVRADLEGMEAALARHGAQGGGLWLCDDVGMGQRLRCFTPQDAFERQPLPSADGQRALVSDARLDNRPELLSAFRLAAGEIPDSELILRAYETWGTDCVRHLAGVFAFAVWDAQAHRLFAARSPIIAPTLVYFAGSAAFAWATMPSGLHALPFIPRALNEERLAQRLAQMGRGSDATFYRDIWKLPTGHWLSAGRDGVQTGCYWRPDLEHTLRLKRDEDYLEAFNDLLERAVGAACCSLTPVAIQMSGGLDSGSVAAVAADWLAQRGERLTAFTETPRSGFDGALLKGRYADETPFVQAIAARYPNLDLNLVHTDGQIFLDDLERLFDHLEEPFRNTSNRVWIEAILQAASRRSLQVLLDGLQGNLTMSWNGSGLLSELLRSGRWAAAQRQARALAGKGSSLAVLRLLVGLGLLPLLPDPAWLALDRLRHPPALSASLIHPDFAAAQLSPGREREGRLRFRPLASSRQERYQALATQDIGPYLSAYRAMYGVDMRTPPADLRLAEFCLALPEEQYLRDGEARRLIRRAMADRLPPAVLANRQRGLQAADWLERLIGARSLVAAELQRLEGSGLAQRVLDLKKMRQMFERMPSDAGGNFDAIAAYRFVFEPALMMGRFLCWFEARG